MGIIFWNKLKNDTNIIDSNLDIINSFLEQDEYLSKSQCLKIKKSISDENELINFNNSPLFKTYCKKKRYNIVKAKELVDCLLNFDENVKKHNEKFVQTHLVIDKEYLDLVLKKCDPNIILDTDQRKAVLSDEDYTLIIAGAGAGKTTTVAAKVKYLVDKKKIDPSEILVISFTNKAVKELQDRINKDLRIACPITTFHSTGNAILRKQQDIKFKVASDSFMYICINNFLKEKVLSNDEILNNIILFFSYYLELDLDVSSIENLKKDLSLRFLNTLRSDLDNTNEIKNQEKKKVTINNERVRSIEEARIANFLYLNNIDYEYEKPYPYYFKGSKKYYCPDFTIYYNGKVIYLEHFGISEDGQNTRYSDSELQIYKKHIKDKIRIHKCHNTTLIYTFSKYNDGKDLLFHLDCLLKEKQIKYYPRSKEEIYKKLQDQKENRYFMKFSKLMENFINNFKINGYNQNDFLRLKSNTNSERTKIFLDLALQVYLYYEGQLKENGYVDFHDMINESTLILQDTKNFKQKLAFKYIFIDEYQDISLQRFDLTKALCKVCNAKIVAVGDDWQSIYAFSGSKIELFTKFKEYMGYANVIRITHTYRNSQELINIAGKFIQKNKEQITKQLISEKSIKYPIAIFTYDDDVLENKRNGRKGIIEQKAQALTKVIEYIVKRQTKKDSSILLVGRYNFDGYNLTKSSLFEMNFEKQIKSVKYPNINITFMSAHSSKGLGYDDVVIINGDDGLYGFPSQIKNDPVLNLVIANDRSYDYAEERRLFYVALTRTKNRVYILSSKSRPSRFVLEIIENNQNQIYIDDNHINKKILDVESKYNKCPVCGYPMYLMDNKYYGKKIWICTNDPEICDFETNDLRGGKTRIRKCPSCKSGYLFVKENKSKCYFLGCSNYLSDNTGCNHTEELDFDPLTE